jgi:hypothetical protein
MAKYLYIQFLWLREYSASPNRLMLYREVIVIYYEYRTKHMNKVCGKNEKSLNIKVGDSSALCH